MKKSIILSYAALLMTFMLPNGRELPPENTPPPPETPAPTVQETREEEAIKKRTLRLWTENGIEETDMEEYLVSVVAAEMPASFEREALKAQAVAARSYALRCAEENKHADADVCTSSGCCQAWQSDEQLREKWGENYDTYLDKIREAVNSCCGEYMSFRGEAVFAAFHSSSFGQTEASADIWSPLPYLVSVSSPESSENVPNYISLVECTEIDFRDTVLHDYPEADMTGAAEDWVRDVQRDGSGRIKSINIGGAEISGTELRRLFSLRSTAFVLEHNENGFLFTVKGYGHGVGMSQYGANVMAENGADYREILLHYYPGVEIVRLKVEN